MKTLIIALIFVFTPSWSLAQTGAGQQNPKPKTKVHTEYIKQKDETLVRILPLELWKPPVISGSGEMNYESVYLVTQFSYPGKKIVKPKFVTLELLVTTQYGPSYGANIVLAVSTESGQFNFGVMELVRTEKSSLPDSHGFVPVFEDFSKSIPFDDFVHIAQSQKVEMKLSDRRKLKLEKSHLKALKDFVTLMEQEGLEF